MAEGAGIDIAFKVDEGNLTGTLNEQVVALERLKETVEGVDTATGALAERNQTLERSQRAVAESSGGLNRSIAGQLTALSRLQGGVAGLLPQLASWTYLIRRLAIAMRGVLSMNPEWIILAGAITALGGAFRFLSEEAFQAMEEVKKLYELMDKRKAMELEVRMDTPGLNRRAMRLGATKSADEMSAEIVKALEDIEDVEKQRDILIPELYEARRLANIFKFVSKGDPSRPLTTGKDFALDIVPQMRYALGEAGVDASGVSTGFYFFKNPLEELFDAVASGSEKTAEHLEELSLNLEKTSSSLAEYVNALDRARVDTLQRESDEAIEADIKEGEEFHAKQDEESIKLGEQVQKILDRNAIRERLEADKESGNMADIEKWLQDLQGERDEANEVLAKYASDLKEARAGTMAMPTEQDRENASKALEGYNDREALIHELTRLRDSMQSLDETIEDKFSIFEKTWGGENEIESHGGRITDYDPYGGLSYTLNSTEIEKRQLEVQQGLLRNSSTMLSEGVTMKVG